MMTAPFDFSYLERGVWRSENFWVSNFNFEDEVVREYQFPERVIFHDVTLRDGEQTPGVVLRRDEKVKIAQALDEVGVNRIEAGMPIVSNEDLMAIKDIVSLGLKAEIYAFCRMRYEDIDAALKSGVDRVIIEGPIGLPKIFYQQGWSPEQVIEYAVNSVQYAVDHGLRVRFFGVDSTRADYAFMIYLFKRVEELGVDGLVVADTYGSLTPEASRYLFKRLRSELGKTLELEFHGHNDFGLATATSLAALSSGANVVHVSVNGLGERAGNTSLEEVALCLSLLYGVRHSIKLENLFELSRLVQNLTRVKVATNKPVVGEMVFARESGLGVAGWMKYPLAAEPYIPTIVGNKDVILIGKKSGRHSIEWKLRHLNLEATEEEIKEILGRVKEASEAKKGPLTDEEFIKIVNEVLVSG
jgi:isopropylmalate/homocitrate/citramalate synthase